MSESPATTRPQTAAESPLHFTRGAGVVCGRRFVADGTLFRASFDEGDPEVDCPLCRMYLRGLRDGRRGK